MAGLCGFVTPTRSLILVLRGSVRSCQAGHDGRWPLPSRCCGLTILSHSISTTQVAANIVLYAEHRGRDTGLSRGQIKTLRTPLHSEMLIEGY
ncbi:hypothetical protein E2C01_006430 [Portunus trituberculatus]|uniref:Uncharacterized protein n=1 Tax=Portunus trituberculatus TaxID=210409 RepID=A0A5B7CZI8_PORTR|nr:hypothetical protein [Portunus trituberculatus]